MSDDPTSGAGAAGSTASTPAPGSTPAPAVPSGGDSAGAGAATPQNLSLLNEAAPAPEHYDFKFAEGVTPPAEVVGAMAEVFKQHGIQQEAAQGIMAELVEKHLPTMQKAAAEDAQKQLTEAGIKQMETWGTEVKNDPTLGQGNLKANLAAATAGIEALGGAPLKEVLTLSGVINNKHVFKALVDAGKLVAEAKSAAGNPAPVEQSMAERWFGPTTKTK